MQYDLPLGHALARSLTLVGEQTTRHEAERRGRLDVFDALISVRDEEPVPAFLHSALCAMSLPTQRPKDDTKGIIREDGKYLLAINPKPVLQIVNNEPVLRSLGLPYGSYPRVVLLYLLSEAVRTQSRDVVLAKSFRAWMQRLGYKSFGGGPRGPMKLIQAQVDRLLACEWQIRWDQDAKARDDTGFAFKEVKLSNEYAGGLTRDGEFVREIRLSEVFFDHLREHAVPLNEVAIRQLKGSSTALDLYTYLAYRLPRIGGDKPHSISWDQLAKHLGNEGQMKRFRQTVRDTFDLVSAVYPEARVDLTGSSIKLYGSPPPLAPKVFGRHLRLIGNSGSAKQTDAGAPGPTPVQSKLPMALKPASVFPSGSLRFGDMAKPFLDIAVAKGNGWDVDQIAGAYRTRFGEEIKDFSPERLLKSWAGFCASYRPPHR
jgi:hypothetical protein